ncbi:MAG: hypothetical protein V1917_02060 [Candidatus Gottesmanbacteria bacterium]
MNEGDPGVKNSNIVVGESGAEYPSEHVEHPDLGIIDRLVDDHEPQPATLAEGE